MLIRPLPIAPDQVTTAPEERIQQPARALPGRNPSLENTRAGRPKNLGEGSIGVHWNLICGAERSEMDFFEKRFQQFFSDPGRKKRLVRRERKAVDHGRFF